MFGYCLKYIVKLNYSKFMPDGVLGIGYNFGSGLW